MQRRTVHALLLGVASFLLVSPLLVAQNSTDLRSLPEVRPHDRVTERIDDRQRIVLIGNRHPLAQPQFEVGMAPPDQPMQGMVLVLRSAAAQDAALAELIQAQQDPASPYFHQWLAPEVFGERFGVSQNDLDLVVNWIEMNGMEVKEIPASRRAIVFDGTAAQVETAFHTPIRKYLVRGQTHFANATNPEIPRALAEVVHGVVSLHDFRSLPAHVEVSPAFTLANGVHLLMPEDWDTIYDVTPLFSQGLDGTGQSIAVLGRTDIDLKDVQTFRHNAGLPANDPQVIVNGADPGIPNCTDEAEAALDVEWAGAIAKKATVKFVTSQSGATDGVNLSAQYAVNHNVAPIVTVSYLHCENTLSPAGNAFWNGLWAQAASQGQSVFVASGDSGAAGCDYTGKTATQGRAVNGMCSSPYSTCVGGTQFDDASNPSLYWLATNDSVMGSALSYIPEVAWNESSWSGALFATGGGVSTVYRKPAWQAAPGVPADGMRDVPDVSMTSAVNDAYVIQVQGKIFYVAGTSAASPSLASVMALVLQNTGGASQGNINPVLYRLATRQAAAGGAAVFHDISRGNNSVPGVTGYNAGVGYDLATGLGSVDANLLVNHWSDHSTSDFALTSNSSSISVAQGGSKAAILTLNTQSGFSSPVTLSASIPAGVRVVFSSLTLTTTTPVTATITAGSNVAAGNYTLTITGTGGGLTRHVSLTLTVLAGSSFTLKPSATGASVAPGGSVPMTLSTAGTNGFKSAIALSVSGLPKGVTGSFAPTSIASPGSGSSRLTLTAATGTAAGVSTLTLTGTGGGVTKTQTLSLTVLAPSFTLTPSAAKAVVAPGGSIPITLFTTGVNGFRSAIMLSVSGLPKGVTASLAPPAIVSLSNGTSKLTLKAAIGMAAGTSTLTLTAKGGGVTKTLTLSLTVSASSAQH